MTNKLLETLTLAEEVLTAAQNAVDFGSVYDACGNAIVAIREQKAELGKQAEQEPVAVKCGCLAGCQYCQGSGWILANAAPVQQVDLTDDEIGSIYEKHHALGGCWTDGFAYERAVIAADRERNK